MTRRTQKQLAHLDALEREFRSRLIEQLRACAVGRCSLLFLVSSMRPESWSRILRSSIADELFAAADEVLTFRARHDLLDEECLAARYRDACRRHVDRDDPHRPGARRQAQVLLQEIGEAE